MIAFGSFQPGNGKLTTFDTLNGLTLNTKAKKNKNFSFTDMILDPSACLQVIVMIQRRGDRGHRVTLKIGNHTAVD